MATLKSFVLYHSYFFYIHIPDAFLNISASPTIWNFQMHFDSIRDSICKSKIRPWMYWDDIDITGPAFSGHLYFVLCSLHVPLRPPDTPRSC